MQPSRRCRVSTFDAMIRIAVCGLLSGNALRLPPARLHRDASTEAGPMALLLWHGCSIGHTLHVESGKGRKAVAAGPDRGRRCVPKSIHAPAWGARNPFWPGSALRAARLGIPVGV